jgi:hypothetical protein
MKMIRQEDMLIWIHHEFDSKENDDDSWPDEKGK